MEKFNHIFKDYGRLSGFVFCSLFHTHLVERTRV